MHKKVHDRRKIDVEIWTEVSVLKSPEFKNVIKKSVCVVRGRRCVGKHKDCILGQNRCMTNCFEKFLNQPLFWRKIIKSGFQVITITLNDNFDNKKLWKLV